MGLEYCSSPVTSFRWLLLAVSGAQQDAKTHHKVQKSQTLTSDPAFQPLSQEYVLFIHPTLLPTKGKIFGVWKWSVCFSVS